MSVNSSRLHTTMLRGLGLLTLVLGANVFAPLAAADQVTLISGDVLNGTILERTDRALVLNHPLFGRMVIPSDQVASTMTTAEIEAAQEAADDEADAAEAPPADETAEGASDESAETIEPEPEPEWESRFTLAGSGSFGNTDSQSLTTKVRSVRETKETITSFDAAYFYGSRSGDRNENRFTAGLRNDWLIPDSRWFYFADGRYDYDEFQGWDHRVSGHAGLGYELFKKDHFSLKLRAGLGAVKEWGSEDDDIRPEALLGADLSWKISDNQKLVASSTIFPDLEETGELRAVNSAEWNALLDAENNLSLTAGLLHEYQSDVDEGIDENDLKVYVGLSFDF